MDCLGLTPRSVVGLSEADRCKGGVPRCTSMSWVCSRLFCTDRGITDQCLKKKGRGPDGDYCYHHAKQLNARSVRKWWIDD